MFIFAVECFPSVTCYKGLDSLLIIHFCLLSCCYIFVYINICICQVLQPSLPACPPPRVLITFLLAVTHLLSLLLHHFSIRLIIIITITTLFYFIMSENNHHTHTFGVKTFWPINLVVYFYRTQVRS